MPDKTVNFKPIQLHAYDLAKALISAGDDPLTYCDVHDWLQIASGIEKVYFNFKYDSCLDYCGIAAEYESAKEELTEEFIRALTIFQFTWGAFEALLNSLSIPPIPLPNRDRTKVDPACYYLKVNERSEFSRLGYEPVFQNMKSQARYILENDKFQSYFSTKKHVSSYSHGLYVVYKIRNHFAHGRAFFPEPHRHEDGVNYEANLIALSSRITLLSIQMLIMARHSDPTAYVDCWWTDQYGDEKDRVPLSLVFSELQWDPGSW